MRHRACGGKLPKQAEAGAVEWRLNNGVGLFVDRFLKIATFNKRPFAIKPGERSMRDAVMDKVLNRLVFLTGWSSEATELAVLTKFAHSEAARAARFVQPQSVRKLQRDRIIEGLPPWQSSFSHGVPQEVSICFFEAFTEWNFCGPPKRREPRYVKQLTWSAVRL